jgi:HEAT repeat protein
MRTIHVVLASLVLVAALGGCRAKPPGPDVDALLGQLRGPDPVKSGQARLKLITLGEPAVPALAEMLRSGAPSDRVIAANTLWGMGGRARAAVPDLAAAVADADPALRVASIMALESMGPAAQPAVSALTTALGDPDRRVRQASVKALGAIGPPARAALPALQRVLKRESWPEAEEAVRRIQGPAPDDGGEPRAAKEGDEAP